MITYRLSYLLLVLLHLTTCHIVKHFDGAMTLYAELFLQHCYQVFNLPDANECKLVVVVAVDVGLLGVVGTDVEGIGSLAAKPWGGVAYGV